MIETKGLTRRFGGVLAVDQASFKVNEGDVYGFLGPNGAGKTTTMRMLTGLIRPTSGSATINGHDILRDSLAAKSVVGFMPEEPAFYDTMTAQKLVAFYGALHGLPRMEAEARAGRLLAEVGLAEATTRKVKGFSHGMRKRVALAQALVNDPKVLILDEPTGGLDPAGTAWFRDFIRDKNREGVTIFLSSHLLHEVEHACNRVGIIARGRIIADDTPGNLSKRLSAGGVTVTVTLARSEPRAVAALRSMSGVTDVAVDGATITVRMADGAGTGRLTKALVDAGADVRGVQVKENDLEQIFLKLTGEGS